MHATDGTVSMLVNTLTCALEIYTIDATPAALPGTGWFSQSVAHKVDGGSAENKFSGYS